MKPDHYLNNLTQACKDAYSIMWDGCHKIYINLDVDSHIDALDIGYEPILVGWNSEEAQETVQEWYDKACPLKFINAVKNETEYYTVIPQ